MILDKELCFADDQAITTDAKSEHVLDLSVARNIGKGEPMAAVIFVKETFETATDNGTLDISVSLTKQQYGCGTKIASALTGRSRRAKGVDPS